MRAGLLIIVAAGCAGTSGTVRPIEGRSLRADTATPTVAAAAPRSACATADAPCWADEVAVAERGRAAAARWPREHVDRRARAQARVLAESSACADLPAAELDHGPFDHREDIAAVTPERDGGRLLGARIRFRPVPRLTRAWLQRSLACQRAIIAATGCDPTHFIGAPDLVEGARLVAADDPAGLVVVIRADEPAPALMIFARALFLLDERPLLDDRHDP